MAARPSSGIGFAALLGVALAGLAAQVPSSQSLPRTKETRVPQTALSTCPALAVVERREVPAGTGLAVSPDGRFVAEFIHTPLGAELTLRERDRGEEHRLELQPPALPPGIAWRVLGAEFSPASDLLLVRSLGKLWIISPETGQVLYTVAADPVKQSYPGKASLAAGRLVVPFWPPESYLADAPARKPVEVRFYEAASGEIRGRLELKLDSSDPWTELHLAPDGNRLAVLLRATRWPGKARLVLFAADTGKPVWERKITAEDLAWLPDSSALLALGRRLVWLDPANGNERHAAEGGVGSSEFQQVRLNASADVAVGEFSRYSAWRRALRLSEGRHEQQFVLWQLDTGRRLCRVDIDRTLTLAPWLTARGEIVTLEETYEVRPPLRLLKASRMVTYKVERLISPNTPRASSCCSAGRSSAANRVRTLAAQRAVTRRRDRGLSPLA
jgi:hypothetical protein